MPITWLDIILLVFMLVSALLAMVRGFMREILSIASWVAAAIAALYFLNRLLPFVKGFVSNDIAAKAITAAGVFIVTLVVVSVITVKISDMILDSRVGALDRTLGFLFGLGRGLLVVAVAYAFFVWFVPDPGRQPEWVSHAKSQWILNGTAERLKTAFQDVDTEGLLKKLFTRPKVDEQEPQDAPPGDRSSLDAPAGATGRGPVEDAGYNRADRRAIQGLVDAKASKTR